MAKSRSQAGSASTYLLVPVFLLILLLIIAVLRSPNLISQEGLGSAIIVSAPLILATFALTPVVIAGRGGVDLSIGPLIGFINVTLVQLVDLGVISSPLAVFAYAIAVGILYHIIMGLIIVYVRVQPIIVSLSGYLAFVGINLVILPRPGGVAPEWMGSWAMGTSIFNPVLAILILATAAWLLFMRTAFYGHLRLMGSDERTAYTSGVRINIVRIGAHIIAGIYAGLAAITFTSLISSGDPSQGTTYTLMAVTALVLGGASLAGGRGGAVGSLLGALNVYLITYVLATFSFGQFQSFVTDLAYGTILVASLLLSLLLPHLQRWTRFVSPFLFFVVLGIIALGVIVHAKYDAVDSSTLPPPVVVGAPSGGEAGVEPPAGGTSVQSAEPQTLAQSRNIFAFEGLQESETRVPPPEYARNLAYFIVLALAAVFMLRMSVQQARLRTLGPLVFLVLIALVILGFYLITENRRNPVEPPASAPVTGGVS